MKTRSFLIAAFGLFLLLGPSLASAQNLDDAARAAREKRMKVMQQRSVRVWTNDNIPKAPAGEGPTAAAGIASAPPPQPSETAVTPAGETSSGSAPAAGTAEDKRKSREYWQPRFKAAKQRLADMEEQQRLAEDELSLLQIQQARELSPDIQSQLAPKIQAASAQVEARRLETAKAKKELEELEKEFKDSGAPDDWSKTD